MNSPLSVARFISSETRLAASDASIQMKLLELAMLGEDSAHRAGD
jgi:hypothetical protein